MFCAGSGQQKCRIMEIISVCWVSDWCRGRQLRHQVQEVLAEQGSAACDIYCLAPAAFIWLFSAGPSAHIYIHPAGDCSSAVSWCRAGPLTPLMRGVPLKFMHRRAHSCKERYTFAGINLPQDVRGSERGLRVLFIHSHERGGHRPLAAAREFPQYCGNETKILLSMQNSATHKNEMCMWLEMHPYITVKITAARLYFILSNAFSLPFETHYAFRGTLQRSAALGINFFSCQRGNKCRSDCCRSKFMAHLFMSSCIYLLQLQVCPWPLFRIKQPF